jgi:predicted dehydrogenase
VSVGASVRVGVVGTSWWADAMYLPPLANHPDAEVVAVCGRNRATTDAFADRWNVAHRFTDHLAMLDAAELDAVIVATSNGSHHDITLAAIERGLHVLCEKPLALDVAQATAMCAAADAAGVVTMVPYTYRYMPVFRFIRRLVADGYVGRVHHINMRYYTAYAFDPAYTWRFDAEVAGSGVIGDLASHWVYVARWLLDDTETSVGALASSFVDREPRPDGTSYEQGEDSVVLTVRYASGAYGILQTCAVSYEGTAPFGQTHHVEIHGDAGTIYGVCDWDTVQEVRGVRRGEPGPAAVIPIPDDIWGGLRRDTVHDTYRDVFRDTDAMTRGWIDAIRDGRRVRPDFADGLAVQRVLDAAVRSARTGSGQVAVTRSR